MTFRFYRSIARSLLKTACGALLLSRCFFPLASAQHPVSELWRAGINLIPSPREAHVTRGAFRLDGKVNVFLDGQSSPESEFAVSDLTRRLTEDWGIEVQFTEASAGQSIRLSLGGTDSELGRQGYELVVSPEAVTITATAETGLFYGTRTLLQLVEEGPGGLMIRGVRIRDWPDIPVRAVHYDTKHHQDRMEYLKDFIQDLADYKINMLIWEWEDKFAYESHPEIGAPGAFTKTEIQDLTRWALRYHVQIVPLIQGLGHVSYILKWPQNAHLREIPASNWEFCPLKEGTYETLFAMWDEAIEATPGVEYLHIGSDETFELGQGNQCGCPQRMAELGNYSFYMQFINRCADHVASKGRRHIAWTPAYRPSEKYTHPKSGPVLSEQMLLDNARLAQEHGYTYWVYTLNPGLEHLFLPYFHRENPRHPGNTLEEAYRTLTTAALSGLYEGMICASWDDSGLHNQAWMMRFVNAAEYAWSGEGPLLEEFNEKYFNNYYGAEARDVRELFEILNHGAYFFMDSFERKVWHWGEIGKTHLPDLPYGDAVEYDPFWNTEYAQMVRRSRSQLPRLERALQICRNNLGRDVRHKYDFELWASVAELIAHNARTYIVLSEVERAIGAAHKARFVSYAKTISGLERAASIIKENLTDREKTFGDLVHTWEQTRLPKGLSTPEKQYLHVQDRARHFANRRADMSYLICDEETLGLEEYLENLRAYTAWFRKHIASRSSESHLEGSGERMTVEELTALPKIDAHAHIMTMEEGELEVLTKALERHNMLWLILCTRGTDWEHLRDQIDLAASLHAAQPERIQWATSFNLENWGDPDWQQEARDTIRDGFDKGAVAVKIWKEIGMVLKDSSGDYVMVDDPRFDAIFNCIESNNKTLVAHIGEPKSCWMPLESMESPNDKKYYKAHPQYHGYLHPEIPHYDEIIAARDRVLERHPDLRLVGCHLGSLEYDVGELDTRFGRYPNFAVDMAERIYYLQMQDRDKVREFMIKWQDRLLYGTDFVVGEFEGREHDIAQECLRMNQTYLADYHYFATSEMMSDPKVGRRFQGLSLPPEVLKKIFYGNARHWYLGL